MKSYLFVFIGGGIGSGLRYWLSGVTYRFLPENFPYGTLAVNVIGCFVIGVFLTLFQERFAVYRSLRTFVAIGILGGFTTFSSFSAETINLLRAGEMMLGSINIVVTMAGCLIACVVGVIIVNLL